MAVIPDLGNIAPFVDQTPTLMQQASANRRANEEAQMRKIEFDIKRPVFEAQARAQLASEALELTATKVVADSVTEDALRFPEFVKAWVESAKTEDPKERLNERRRILGAISPLAAVKTIKPMVDMFRQQYMDDATADKTADVLAGKVEVAGVQADAKMEAKKLDLQAREAKLKFDSEKFQLQQQHAMELQKVRDEAAQKRVETAGANAVKTAETKARGASMVNRDKEATKITNAITADVPNIQDRLARFQNALTILDDPEIRTGTGAKLSLAGQRLSSLLGIPMRETASMEQLSSTLGSTFLDSVKVMKGNLSDKDREALQAISPSLAMTNEGNKALLKMAVQRMQRDLQVADLIHSLEVENASPFEIKVAVDEFVNSHPLDFSALLGGATGGLTPAEQTRLQELRSKLGK